MWVCFRFNRATRRFRRKKIERQSLWRHWNLVSVTSEERQNESSVHSYLVIWGLKFKHFQGFASKCLLWRDFEWTPNLLFLKESYKNVFKQLSSEPFKSGIFQCLSTRWARGVVGGCPFRVIIYIMSFEPIHACRQQSSDFRGLTSFFKKGTPLYIFLFTYVNPR